MQTLGERLQEARQRLGVTLEKAGADFNTHHSAKAARRPLEAGVEEDAAFEPAGPASAVTVNRDMLVYGSLAIGVIAILIWAFFR
ncbi:MAG: hypothetical protein EBS64_05775 [Verrucomicrobia bacterium]|nr:hypothetical protein [Verrucomicrobiota bacterium]